MSEYKILPSQVLIVPGYTNDEIIAMSAQTKNSSASALKNATSSTDKTAKDEDKTSKKSTSSSSSSAKSSSSSQTKSQTKSRMLKSKKQAKTINEILSAAKKVLYNPPKSDNHGKYKPDAYWAYMQSKNKSTTTNTTKDKSSSSSSSSKSTTKSTSKTKTTKKTSKASKKKKTTSKTTKSSAGSGSSSSKSSKKKNSVTESSAATATESQVKIDKPKALLFSPESVDYTPHRKDYEEFNSADGLILIEKACDVFAELQLSLSVHQAMRIQENGTIELSNDDKRPIDIITEGAPTIWDPETDLGHFIDPADFTDSYIEIRRSFFDNYKGRPLTLVSDLFPTMPVCYITDISYNINEGEEQAEYSITFKEVDNTWG